MYQAVVQFKLNHIFLLNTLTLALRNSHCFPIKGGLHRDLMRGLSRSLLTNTNLVIPWNPKWFVGWQGSSHHLSLIHDKSRGSSKADTPTALGSAMQPDAVLGIFPWHHSIWALHCHLKSMRQTETIWRGWEMDNMSAWCLCLVFGYKVITYLASRQKQILPPRKPWCNCISCNALSMGINLKVCLLWLGFFLVFLTN